MTHARWEAIPCGDSRSNDRPLPAFGFRHLNRHSTLDIERSLAGEGRVAATIWVNG